MAKLNKTQTALMQKLGESRIGRISVESCSGRGPEGGRISFGYRDLTAALKLVEQGMLVVLNRSSSTTSNRGYGYRNTIIVLGPAPVAVPAAKVECDVGLHSWVGEVGLLPPDTACTHCGEEYGHPS